MEKSVDDILRSGINGGLNKQEGPKFQSKTLIVWVCNEKVGVQMIRNGKKKLYTGIERHG